VVRSKQEATQKKSGLEILNLKEPKSTVDIRVAGTYSSKSTKNNANARGEKAGFEHASTESLLALLDNFEIYTCSFKEHFDVKHRKRKPASPASEHRNKRKGLAARSPASPEQYIVSIDKVAASPSRQTVKYEVKRHVKPPASPSASGSPRARGRLHENSSPQTKQPKKTESIPFKITDDVNIDIFENEAAPP